MRLNFQPRPRTLKTLRGTVPHAASLGVATFGLGNGL